VVGVAAVVPLVGADSVAKLSEAIQRGDRQAVRALLARPAEVKAIDADGTTPLHWAVQADDVELVRALLKAGEPRDDGSDVLRRHVLRCIDAEAGHAEREQIIEIRPDRVADLGSRRFEIPGVDQLAGLPRAARGSTAAAAPRSRFSAASAPSSTLRPTGCASFRARRLRPAWRLHAPATS